MVSFDFAAFFGSYFNSWQGYLTFGALILFLLLLVGRLAIPSLYKSLTRGINSLLQRIPVIKNMNWKTRIMGIMIICGIVTLTPVNPITQNWVWDWFGGTIIPDGSGEGHLKFDGGLILRNVDITFEIVNGYDEDDYADTAYDSATVVFYTYTSLSTAYEDGFLNGDYSLKTFLHLSAMEVIGTATASSGVVTTTSNAFTCGQTYLMMIGTYNAAEDGNDPLKSIFYHAIVQGANDPSDSTVSFGLGTFYYWASPDEDDLTVTGYDENYGAYSKGTTFDWSDDTDNVVGIKLKLTFGDEDYGLFSYYQPAENRWWNWYIAIDIVEDNCTTSEAMDITCDGYSVGQEDLSDGVAAYVLLTSGKIFTSNDKPNAISYDLDSEVDPLTPANWWFSLKFDLKSCTSVGADNARQFEIAFDFGTDYNTASLLADGQIRDDATDNNYHVSGASTYYVIA
jgi:hypothetical protein